MELLLPLSLVLGLIVLSKAPVAVVAGLILSAAFVLSMSQESFPLQNISPAFFQPSTDLLNNPNDPLGVYSFDQDHHRPLSYTRSFEWN
jgi:hypothetical protein